MALLNVSQRHSPVNNISQTKKDFVLPKTSSKRHLDLPTVPSWPLSLGSSYPILVEGQVRFVKMQHMKLLYLHHVEDSCWPHLQKRHPVSTYKGTWVLKSNGLITWCHICLCGLPKLHQLSMTLNPWWQSGSKRHTLHNKTRKGETSTLYWGAMFNMWALENLFARLLILESDTAGSISGLASQGSSFGDPFRPSIRPSYLPPFLALFFSIDRSIYFQYDMYICIICHILCVCV